MKKIFKKEKGIALTALIVIVVIIISFIATIVIIINKETNKKEEEKDFETTKSGMYNITNDNGTEFINNEVIIYFYEDVKESRQKEIIKEINGKIISRNSIIKDYEVQLDKKFDTYASITEFCNSLEKKYSEIEMATPDEILYIQAE